VDLAVHCRSLIHLPETSELPREVPDARGACSPFRGGARQEHSAMVVNGNLSSMRPFLPRSPHTVEPLVRFFHARLSIRAFPPENGLQEERPHEDQAIY